MMDLPRTRSQMKSLLCESIFNICQNSLAFQTHVSVEGLLGITLDHKEVFLVTVNQSAQKLGKGITLNPKSKTKQVKLPLKKQLQSSKKNEEGSGVIHEDDKEVFFKEDVAKDDDVLGPANVIKEDSEGYFEKEVEPIMCASGEVDTSGNIKESVEQVDKGRLENHFPDEEDGKEPKVNIGSIMRKQEMQVCQKCDKPCTGASGYSQHIDMVHSGQKSHSCAVCEKNFTREVHLKRHMITHTGKKPYKCSSCGKAFVRVEHMRRHHRIHTGEKPYICTYCGRGFSQEANMRTHEKLHTGEKSHHCHICQKSFSQEPGLKKHLRTHTGEKPYQCDVCGKSFAVSDSLRFHKLTHTGELPHSCHFCNKKFARAESRKDHERIHTGEKPFHCCYCDMRFARRCYKREHERIHTGERPFKCDQCDASYAQHTNLKKHKLNVHKHSSVHVKTQHDVAQQGTNPVVTQQNVLKLVSLYPGQQSAEAAGQPENVQDPYLNGMGKVRDEKQLAIQNVSILTGINQTEPSHARQCQPQYYSSSTCVKVSIAPDTVLH